MSSRRTTLRDLFDACIRGDLPTVRQAVADGLDVKNARDDRYYYLDGYYHGNCTPLHQACRKGHLEIVQFLVNGNHCQANAVDSDRWTALHYAAWNGHLEIVQFLVNENHCQANAVNNNGWTALHLAAQKGYLKVVQTLVNGKDTNPNAVTKIGKTAVHLAAENGHLEIIQFLVNGNHCQVNAIDSYRVTVLHEAAEFNPNLYADGKVCLSLLGTWHGGDATEKWDPLRSNLLQVLLSIQGMILIPDPMFNEPGYEAIRGSDEENAQSRKYNADIEVYTLRYAMVEQLRNPQKGFEDIIQVHFAIQREAIMKQLSQWVKEVISPEHERKLRKAIDNFRAELDKL